MPFPSKRARRRAHGGPLALLLSVLFLFLASAEGASAQAGDESASVQGSVTDARTGEPISGVSVLLRELDRRTLTDARGHFAFRGLEGSGPFTLEVQQLGYEGAEVSIATLPATDVEVQLTSRALPLPTVVVTPTGEARERRRVAASVGSIDGERLRELQPAHPAEAANRIAGVYVSPTSTEGHMTAIRQPITTTPVFLFTEDGVPTRSTGFFNHNALYEVNVAQSDGMEVMKGPGTALYGSDAVGGVVDVRTRAPSLGPQLTTSMEGNSLGYARFLASASNSWSRDGLRLDLNLTDGDSWRDDADFDRQSATLRWDRVLRDDLRLRTTATYTQVTQSDPSVLSAEDLARHPERNYQPITFRDVQAMRIASTLERTRPNSYLRITPFFRWNQLDLMPHWQFAFDPTIHTTGHRSLGLMTRARRALDWVPGQVVAGTDLDWSPGSREERAITLERDGPFVRGWEEGDLVYDYDVTFASVSPYVQLELQPLEWLDLSGGLRFDALSYDYTTRLAPTDEGQHRRPVDTDVSYTNLSPSVGLAVNPRPEIGAFASWREAFRVPSEGQLFRQGTAENTVDLEPVLARSLDVGLRGLVADALGWEVTAFRMDKQNDILAFDRPDGGGREATNAGQTLHRGLELGLRANPGTWVEAGGTLTLARHTYEEWTPGQGVDYSGNEMEQAPSSILQFDVATRLPWRHGGRLEVEALQRGSSWMDPGNEERYGGHTLFNVRASLAVTERAQVLFRVMNLTDRTYAERASFNAFRGEEFSPGAPRAVHLGLRIGGNR